MFSLLGDLKNKTFTLSKVCVFVSVVLPKVATVSQILYLKKGVLGDLIRDGRITTTLADWIRLKPNFCLIEEQRQSVCDV